MLTDAHVPGSSPVHRMPLQYLLVALAAFCTLLFLSNDWLVLALGAGVVAIGYGLAGLPLRAGIATLRPLAWILAAIFLIHLITTSAGQGLFVITRLVILILAASIITMTKRTSEFVDGIQALLKYAPGWVPAGKIALAIALAIRFIPSVRGIVSEIREAQRARGLDRSFRAMLVPLIVRTLKMADQVAEALEARSAGKL